MGLLGNPSVFQRSLVTSLSAFRHGEPAGSPTPSARPTYYLSRMHNIINKKKVLFLITKSNWGGAQRYVYDLATNLDQGRFEPVVALGGKGILADMLKNAGIRVITIESLERDISVKKEWVFARELWKILRTEKPDVFHVNSSKAGGVGTLLGRLQRVPNVIFTAHGWAFNEDRPLWQKLVTKFLHWVTVLLSHRTIAVSSAIVKEMNWPAAERKMKIVNPGRTIGPMYEKDASREKIMDFFPRLLPYQSDPWLVCVAELHPIKRHRILIEAMGELVKNYPALRLILIGEGELKNTIEKQITDSNLTENVFILGKITEAARFLKAFDMFVLASKSESYGYVLHEAGLAGLPVVATNVGGIPDIITNNQSGLLIPPDNVSDLYIAIKKLLNEPNTAQSLASNLLDKMSTRTIEKMIRVTEDLYRH